MIKKLKEKDIEFLVRKIIHEEKSTLKNYMFFQNIKQIKDNIDTILSMDEMVIDNIINDGHDWASDHISTSKDDVEEVYNFLKNRVGVIGENYYDFDWDKHLGKTETVWYKLEEELSTCIKPIIEKYKTHFGNDSYGVIDATFEILNKMFQRK